MKLLGWMHRKLMQKGVEPMKNTTIGKSGTCFSMQAMFDEKNFFIDPTKDLSCSNVKCQKSSDKYEADEDVLYQQELLEPFDFLSIGTFGMELLHTDPPTPALPTPLGELTSKKTEITEGDLKLINYELEKFLEAEEKEILNDTSERSSHVSMTTLVNKAPEGTDYEEHMHMETCPLQNYLLATSIELAEAEQETKREKASLGELLKRNNIINYDTAINSQELEHQSRKANIGRFMKKVVKKIHMSSSSSKITSKNVATTSSSTVTKKLSKAIKKFQRKVHPEKTPENQSTKLPAGRKINVSAEEGRQIGGADGRNMYDQAATGESKEITMKFSADGIWKGPSTESGHWIKTDSDYVVLELQG